MGPGIIGIPQKDCTAIIDPFWRTWQGNQAGKHEVPKGNVRQELATALQRLDKNYFFFAGGLGGVGALPFSSTRIRSSAVSPVFSGK